jgi:hypothetical protein
VKVAVGLEGVAVNTGGVVGGTYEDWLQAQGRTAPRIKINPTMTFFMDPSKGAYAHVIRQGCINLR